MYSNKRDSFKCAACKSVHHSKNRRDCPVYKEQKAIINKYYYKLLKSNSLCTEEYDLIYTKKLSKVLEENDSETEHSGILKKLLNGMDEINRWRDDVNNKVNEIIEANNDSVDLTENFKGSIID